MNKGGRIRRRGSSPSIVCDEAPCPSPTVSGSCHIYRFGKTSKGYGQTSIRSRAVLVHRYVWEVENGPIPAGLEIDHQCRNRACCNPDHLRVVTKKTNVTENVVGNCWQRELAKTHCPKGHPYDEQNTAYRAKPGAARPHRYCRTCNREKAAANRQKERASRASV